MLIMVQSDNTMTLVINHKQKVSPTNAIFTYTEQYVEWKKFVFVNEEFSSSMFLNILLNYM